MYILPETTKLLEYKPNFNHNSKNVEIIIKNAKKLQEYKSYIDEKVKSGEISVFSLDKFPTTTNNYKFSPKDLYECLIEYSENTQGLETILKNRGITRNTFNLLCSKYTEIQNLFEQSFYRKAGCYEDFASRQIEELPQECWKETKWGKELSYPGVRLLEHRFNGALRLAAIHNREVYGDKTQIDQRSVSVNFSGSINDVSPNNRDISNIDLIRDLFGKYRQ